MRVRRFPLWSLLAVVLVVALLVGSGVFSSSPPTAAERAASIESVLRCPSCEDLSVADSSAPTAATVRATVLSQVQAGRSDQQIESYLVARYGSSIVLDPPASGLSLLVWLLPLLVGLAAVAGAVVVVVRRRRSPDGTDGSGPVAGLDADALAEQRRFLDQSLADADAEYLAGDLSDKDYLALRRRDMARLAAIDARLGGRTAPDPGAPSGPAGEPVPAVERSPAGRPSPAPTFASATAVTVVERPTESDDPGTDAVGDELPAGVAAGRPRARRSRRSSWFLAGAVGAFAAALILAVTLFASNRAPGQTITGSITLSQGQQTAQTLSEAATEVNNGELGQAAQLYQSVLTKHPDNEVALAQLGWLEYETGAHGESAALIDDARTKLDRAVQLDPTDYAARLYLGTFLLDQDHDAAGAVAQYRDFLADRPPSSLVAQAAPEVRQAFEKAGLPVPAQVGS
jgi:cytochrome c-type biogenesis protein CcmH